MIAIGHADDLEVVRELFREYAAGTGVDLSFQNFDDELETLANFYETILVAKASGDVAGCVALRRIDESTCEMKRLYVRDPYRGTGAGRALAQSVIEEARRRGYARMLLDTLPTMQAATKLYESLGFREVPAYRYNPVPGTKYLQLDL
jgi:ribosomal protein S18 acetylase RimI-like enzyme